MEPTAGTGGGTLVLMEHPPKQGLKLYFCIETN